MRVHYFHASNLLEPAANVIQGSRMCEAFARMGVEVTLWYPRYLWGNTVPPKTWREFYGIDAEIEARALPVPLPPGMNHGHWALPLFKLPAYLVVGLLLILFGGLTKRDVIFTRCYFAAGFFSRWFRVLPRGRRPQVVFEVHGLTEGALRRRALRSVDVIVAVSEPIAEHLQAQLGFPKDRILVAGNAIPATWLEGECSAQEIRRELEIQVDKPLVVCTGGLYSGTIPLLMTLAKAFEGEAEFLSVGRPPGPWDSSMKALESLREELRLASISNLELHDPVPPSQIRAYQLAADVLVAPYGLDLETADFCSPVKLAEYMSTGRPLVTTDFKVFDSFLRHSENSWLVATDDADNFSQRFVQALRELLADTSLQERLAQTARQDVSGRTCDHRAGRILGFVSDVSVR